MYTEGGPAVVAENTAPITPSTSAAATTASAPRAAFAASVRALRSAAPRWRAREGPRAAARETSPTPSTMPGGSTSRRSCLTRVRVMVALRAVPVMGRPGDDQPPFTRTAQPAKAASLPSPQPAASDACVRGLPAPAPAAPLGRRIKCRPRHPDAETVTRSPQASPAREALRLVRRDMRSPDSGDEGRPQPVCPCRIMWWFRHTVVAAALLCLDHGPLPAGQRRPPVGR